MDNQHQLIKGYRDLSQGEIDLINEGKEVGRLIAGYVEKLRGMASLGEATSATPEGTITIDKRWLAIGVTDLQKGMMAVTRSIAKPGFF